MKLGIIPYNYEDNIKGNDAVVTDEYGNIVAVFVGCFAAENAAETVKRFNAYFPTDADLDKMAALDEAERSKENGK